MDKHNNQQKNHYLYNCLIGGAVGDALGLPFEGLSPKRIHSLFKNHKAYNLIPFIHLGMLSDDTEHAIMTVQSYISSKGDEQKFKSELSWHLRLWLLGLPAGVGFATLKSLFKLWFFLPKSGVFSAGNGGAMRSAVLGVMVEDLSKLRDFVSISTNITHTDPKAVEGSMVVALSSWFNCYNVIDKNSIESHRKELLSFLLKHIKCGELKGYLQSAYNAVLDGKTLNEYIFAEFNQNMVTGYMYHTIPAVIFTYFKYPFEPMKGFECLINGGGDVDTTCAIAGGIWGVNYGEQIYNQIKGGWLELKITPYFLQNLSKQFGMATPKVPRFGGMITLFRNIIFLLIVLIHGFRRLLPPY